MNVSLADAEAFAALLRQTCRSLRAPIALLARVEGASVTCLAQEGAASVLGLLGGSFCVATAAAGIPLWVPDIREHPSIRLPDPWLSHMPGAGALVSAPVLRLSDSSSGVICAVFKRRRAFTEADHEALNDLVKLAVPLFETLDLHDAPGHSATAGEAGSVFNRTLLELFPNFVAVMDGKVLSYINPAGAALLGFEDVAEATDLLWSKFVHPDDHSLIAARRASTLESGQANEPVVIRFLARDGEVVDAETRSVATVYQGRPAVLVVAHDVRSRLRTVSALRDSERSLATAQELANVGSWEQDLTTGLVSWSDTLYRLLGYEPLEVVPSMQALIDRTHPAERARFVAGMRGWNDLNEVDESKRRIVRPNGEVRHLTLRVVLVRSATGVPQRLIGTTHDVTEVTDAAEALRAAVAMFRSVFETANDAMAMVDEMQIIVLANPAAYRIFGWKPGTLSGKPLHVLVPRGHREVLERALARVSSSEIGCLNAQQGDLTGLRRNGTEVPIETSIATWTSDHGRFYGVVFRDITERNEVARQQQVFLTTVSHELRTPLTLINTTLELMAEPMIGEGHSARLLEIAQKSTDRLTRLVGDLLDAQAMAAGKLRMVPHPHNVAELIDRAADMATPAFHAAGIGFLVRSSPLTLTIDGDRVVQVLINLLDNARKAAPVGSTVILEQDVGQDAVFVRVHDQGPGVPLEARQAVFERFVRLGPNGGARDRGTGLGLAICRAIVEAHGGTIWIDDARGAGATVTFTLPLEA
jgi:PAS domain S-box-containing protein